jgi:hypothetical protein
VAKCWERRGCDEEMESRCPHADDPEERCPARCAYGQCQSPRRATPGDPLLVFEPNVDRTAVIKEQCLYCEFFLTNGPRLS